MYKQIYEHFEIYYFPVNVASGKCIMLNIVF